VLRRCRGRPGRPSTSWSPCQPASVVIRCAPPADPSERRSRGVSRAGVSPALAMKVNDAVAARRLRVSRARPCRPSLPIHRFVRGRDQFSVEIEQVQVLEPRAARCPDEPRRVLEEGDSSCNPPRYRGARSAVPGSCLSRASAFQPGVRVFLVAALALDCELGTIREPFTRAR